MNYSKCAGKSKISMILDVLAVSSYQKWTGKSKTQGHALTSYCYFTGKPQLFGKVGTPTVRESQNAYRSGKSERNLFR